MVGGDIEIASTIDLSFRPREIDYLLTAFGGNTSESGTPNQNSVRPRALQA
jgi:hypothetical protein